MNFTDRIRRLPLKLLLHRFFSALLCLLLLGAMSIAVDRYAKAGEHRTADFIPCTAWGKTAEFIGKYFVKGQEILAEGRIQTGSYEKDGRKIYTTDVVIDRVEFCGKAVAKNATTTSQEDLPF